MNRRRALLLCGLHRKRYAQLHGRARASRYAAAGAADAAGLRLFEAGRAKPSAAGAKRTAQQVRAYGAGTAKSDLRLRIGKRILSDTERITAKSSGKAAAKAAKGLRCTVRAGQAFSPTLQSRMHPHLYAQKLLRAAVLTQKSGAYAAAHSSRMRAAAAEHKASAQYRGHAYAQKLLYPAILAQKTKRSAFARASQPAPAAAERRARALYRGHAYAQKLLRPAALAQRTKARNILRAHAAADAACASAFGADSYFLPRAQAGKRLPTAQRGKAVFSAAAAETGAAPARQKTTGQSSHAAKALEKTPRPAGAEKAAHSACSAAVYSEEKAPAARLSGKGRASGALQPKTVRALAAALCSAAGSSAGGTAQQSGGSTWEAPVLADGTLTVTMVYEAAQQGETLSLA
nr:MAG TPA: hypothetical protein [Caudoviricetes sp.]